MSKIREYKDKMVMEMVAPLMEEKGFTLQKPEPNFWQWDIWIEEIYQYVQLYDTKGCIYLIIGRGESHWPGEALLPYMENARTKKGQWQYGRFERDGMGKEALLKDIFADCRDILEKYCDKIIQDCVEEIKKEVPNRHHFLRFQAEYDVLSEEYYQKLDMKNKDAMEALESVREYIEPLRGKSVVEVETDLLGLAAAYEKKILEEYGGEKGIKQEFDSSYICKVGKNKTTLNILLDIFFSWQVWEHWKSVFYSVSRLEKK